MAENLLRIAVLSCPENPALAALPESLPNTEFQFIIANDLDGCLLLRDITVLVIIPPFKQEIVDQAWDVAFSNISWIHAFSTGVDFIAELTRRRLVNRDDIVFTNGRGAFSR